MSKSGRVPPQVASKRCNVESEPSEVGPARRGHARTPGLAGIAFAQVLHEVSRRLQLSAHGAEVRQALAGDDVVLRTTVIELVLEPCQRGSILADRLLPRCGLRRTAKPHRKLVEGASNCLERRVDVRVVTGVALARQSNPQTSQRRQLETDSASLIENRTKVAHVGSTEERPRRQGGLGEVERSEQIGGGPTWLGSGELSHRLEGVRESTALITKCRRKA